VRFRAEKFALYNKNGLYDRYIEYGICPVCGREIAVLSGRRFSDNRLVTEKLVKRKAVNLYNECMQDITHGIQKIKHGAKSNAGFFYGENRELKKGGIRRYRVDFNNKKDLIEEAVLNG